MKKLLLLAAAALAMSACADATTAPTRRAVTPSSKAAADGITCRSGYIVAYDENGNPYCAPDGTSGTTTTSSSQPLPRP